MLTLALPSPISTVVFVALVAVSWLAAVLVRGSGLPHWPFLQTAIHFLEHPNPTDVRRVLSALWEALRAPPRAYALAALALMALSAYSFRPGSFNTLETGFWLMVIGGIALGAALKAAPAHLRPAAVTDGPLVPARARWKWVGAGVFCLFLVSEANGQVLGVKPLDDMSHHLQFALFVGGVALSVWGLSGATWRWPPRWRPDLTRLEATTLLAIVAVALFLRLWGLDETLRVLVDELHWVEGVQYFWEFGDVPLLTPMTGISPYSWFYPYWEVGTVALFGRNLTGLRAVSSIIGALNVLAVYGLGRALFDRKVAMLGAAALAFFPPHIHFSRIAMPLIGDPLFGTLALAFTMRALKTNRRADYALGGAALGMTQYFFEGGRLLFPLVVAAWLGYGWLAWRPRPRWRNLVVLALAALIVGLPFYYSLFGIRAPFVQRLPVSGQEPDVLLDQVREGQTEDYLWHLKSALLYHVHLAEQPAIYYYGGDDPLILSYLVPFFLLGLAYLIWHARAPGIALLVWVGLNVIGNSFLLGSYTAARYIVVLPALALIIAVGLRHTLALIWPDGQARALRTLGVAALVAVIGAAQVGYYFGPHLERFNVQAREARDGDGEDAIYRALGFPDGTHIHIVTYESFAQDYGRALLSYLRDGLSLDVIPPDQFTSAYLEGLPRHVDHAFFILQNDNTAVRRLRARFPSAQYRGLSPYNVPVDKQLALYYVARLPAAQGGFP